MLLVMMRSLAILGVLGRAAARSGVTLGCLCPVGGGGRYCALSVCRLLGWLAHHRMSRLASLPLLADVYCIDVECVACGVKHTDRSVAQVGAPSQPTSTPFIHSFIHRPQLLVIINAADVLDTSKFAKSANLLIRVYIIR